MQIITANQYLTWYTQISRDTGLLQYSVGWHSITPRMALAIGDECRRRACLRVIKVRPHHAAPTPITLAESSMADRLQAGTSGLQMSSWHRHTSLTNFIIQQSRSFEGICVPLRVMNCLFLVPNSQPIRRLTIFSRRCTDLELEQSCTAYHICSVTSCLLLLLEDILLRTQ